MPRRANATSYGEKSGNPRGKGPPKGSGGAPPEVFRRKMALLASRHETVKRLEEALTGKEDATFLKAFAECADRGYGKAPSSVDVTSAGEKVAGLLVIPPET